MPTITALSVTMRVQAATILDQTPARLPRLPGFTVAPLKFGLSTAITVVFIFLLLILEWKGGREIETSIWFCSY